VKLVESVSIAVTVLEGVMSEVAHLQTVKVRIADAIKKSVNFNWIRLTACSLHYQRIEDEIVSECNQYFSSLVVQVDKDRTE
jgi:hypothetical protein